VRRSRRVTISASPRLLKVCHVFGGTEGGRWAVEQLDALARQGCECVAILAGETGSTPDLCRALGIPFKAFDFRLNGWASLFRFPLTVIRMALWMRRERFDVVQSHVFTSTLFARPAAWLADVPVRFAMVTSPIYMQAPTLRWFEKATLWMETGVIPTCKLTSDLYREAGVPAELIKETLYYGPPADRFDPARATSEGLRTEFGLAQDAPLIGCVAIFYPRSGEGSLVAPDLRNRFIKGHPGLFRAMRYVLEEFPDARLVLIGRGWGADAEAIEEEMRELVRAEGLEDVIHFAGWRANPAGVYLDLDVSVQASLADNLGGTIESLLMARPTVATRVGGLVDSVIEGQTGVLVSPDDPEDLARGIRELLRDPERAAELGRAGRALMLSRFTLETTAPALAALYRRSRAAATGAFRPLISAGRLLGGAIVAPAILARGTFDILLFLRARRRARRQRSAAVAKAAAMRPPAALPARSYP
jgi:glycosyltransferase involved in cell wall biosynthesis